MKSMFKHFLYKKLYFFFENVSNNKILINKILTIANIVLCNPSCHGDWYIMWLKWANGKPATHHVTPMSQWEASNPSCDSCEPMGSQQSIMYHTPLRGAPRAQYSWESHRTCWLRRPAIDFPGRMTNSEIHKIS